MLWSAETGRVLLVGALCVRFAFVIEFSSGHREEEEEEEPYLVKC
jgi:hypothetical protein